MGRLLGLVLIALLALPAPAVCPPPLPHGTVPSPQDGMDAPASPPAPALLPAVPASAAVPVAAPAPRAVPFHPLAAVRSFHPRRARAVVVVVSAPAVLRI